MKTRSGEEFGTIDDISLDIDRETVAAIHVVRTSLTDGKPESLSVPITRLHWTGAGGDIVVDAQPGTPPALSSPSDSEDTSRVVLFSTLGDIPIHNARGDKLGSITDFGIAPHKGRITYAVMVLDAEASTADTLYPIPLAAFVVRANTKQWIMELPEGILENTPTMIKKGRWPAAPGADSIPWRASVSSAGRERPSPPNPSCHPLADGLCLLLMRLEDPEPSSLGHGSQAIS